MPLHANVTDRYKEQNCTYALIRCLEMSEKLSIVKIVLRWEATFAKCNNAWQLMQRFLKHEHKCTKTW